MQRDAADTLALPDGPLSSALAQLDASRAFRSASRHRALLHYLVARLLAGQTASLKESVIAVEVFGRSAQAFDPVRDSIVRVEARRLRARLASYHADEGRGAALRIVLPVGSYVPLLLEPEALPPTAEATRRARDLVERGEHFLRQPLSRTTLEAALARFDEALRESPASAAACVGLARAWLNLATGWYADPAVACEHAAEALQQALAIDATQPLAHALLGALQNQFHRDWPAAQRSFRRALALAPDSAFVRSSWGCHLAMRGLLNDAEAELLLARRLDPQYVNTRTHMINLRLAQGRLSEAAAEWNGLADLAPGSLAVEGLGAVLAVERGDAAAAVGHYRRACELMPENPACQAHLAGALALAGDRAQALALLDELPRRFAGRITSPYVMAIVALRMGDSEESLALLRRALDESDPNVLLVPTDPSLGALRGEPRFAALCAELRLRRGRRPQSPVQPDAATPAAPPRRPATAATSPAPARRAASRR